MSYTYKHCKNTAWKTKIVMKCHITGSDCQHKCNTYSNTSSFFFLTILILHHKSAHNHKRKWKKNPVGNEKQKEFDSKCLRWQKVCQMCHSWRRRWGFRWRYFSVHCSDWWQPASVAKVTHQQREAFPLWHCPIHMLLSLNWWLIFVLCCTMYSEFTLKDMKL